MKFLRLAVILSFAVFLTGCKETLYSNLHEEEVNIMVSILAQSGINATKEKQTEKEYALLVDEENFARSVQILNIKGYPKKKFQSFGDVFSDQGLVKTPFEQKARYIHALNQELSRSISEIQGVVTARVHVMIPEREKFGEVVQQPTAAIMIQHNANISLDNIQPKIKQLVAHSVNGLSYENVSIVLVPLKEFEDIRHGQDVIQARETIANQPAHDTLGKPTATAPLSLASWLSVINMKITAGIIFLCMGIFITIGLLYYRRTKVKE